MLSRVVLGFNHHFPFPLAATSPARPFLHLCLPGLVEEVPTPSRAEELFLGAGQGLVQPEPEETVPPPPEVASAKGKGVEGAGPCQTGKDFSGAALASAAAAAAGAVGAAASVATVANIYAATATIETAGGGAAAAGAPGVAAPP